jgi:hypothetical protein
MPVKALTSAVFPWSMCPAVPMIIDFIQISVIDKKSKTLPLMNADDADRKGALYRG